MSVVICFLTFFLIPLAVPFWGGGSSESGGGGWGVMASI